MCSSSISPISSSPISLMHKCFPFPCELILTSNGPAFLTVSHCEPGDGSIEATVWKRLLHRLVFILLAVTLLLFLWTHFHLRVQDRSLYSSLERKATADIFCEGTPYLQLHWETLWKKSLKQGVDLCLITRESPLVLLQEIIVLNWGFSVFQPP